jgi:hypothetical protein
LICDEGNQGQLPIDIQQVGQHEGDGQRVADADSDSLGGGGRHLLRVERHFGKEKAGGSGVVERRGHPQQVIGCFAAKVEHNARADPRQAVLADVRADATQNEHADDQERQIERHLGADGAELVQNRLHDPQHHHVGGRDQQHSERGQAEDRSVGTQVTE